MELTDDEVRRFADACSNPANQAASQVMTAAGAASASGVLARLLIAPADEHVRLIKMIRRALEE